MTEFVILALATWRLASLLAVEDGPWGMFDKIRECAGVEYGADGEPNPTNEFARGLTCVWCNSVWVGVTLTIIYVWFGTSAIWAAMPFALSASAVVVEQIINYDDRRV